MKNSGINKTSILEKGLSKRLQSRVAKDYQKIQIATSTKALQGRLIIIKKTCKAQQSLQRAIIGAEQPHQARQITHMYNKDLPTN